MEQVRGRNLLVCGFKEVILNKSGVLRLVQDSFVQMNASRIKASII
jgi:hypothetical protein